MSNFYDEVYYKDSTAADSAPLKISPSTRRENLFYKSLICPAKGEKLLDVGCGTGNYLSSIRSSGGNLWGIDISEIATRNAKKVVDKPEQILCTNADGSLPFAEEEFDYVTAWGVIEHLPSIPKILQEIRRVAKPAATIAIMVPNVYYYSFILRTLRTGAGPVKHQEIEVLYSFKEWKDLIEASGLTVVKTDRHNKFNRSPFVIWLRRLYVPFYLSNHFIYICKKKPA